VYSYKSYDKEIRETWRDVNIMAWNVIKYSYSPCCMQMNIAIDKLR